MVERLQPDRIDQNLALLTDFLRQFPESKHLNRVAFDLYNCSFHKGKQLWREADAAEKSGDITTARERHSLAREYFQYVRSLQNRIEPDKAAGIEPSDVLDYRDDVLETYYLEKDYADLQSASAALLAESVPGDVGWMIGTLYNAVGLLAEPTPNTPEAAMMLDEILAKGFRNKPDHDHWVIAAAKWRIYAARRLGDTKKAPELVRWIRDSDCTKNIKAKFLKVYGAMAGPKN